MILDHIYSSGHDHIEFMLTFWSYNIIVLFDKMFLKPRDGKVQISHVYNRKCEEKDRYTPEKLEKDHTVTPGSNTRLIFLGKFLSYVLLPSSFSSHFPHFLIFNHI